MKELSMKRRILNGQVHAFRNITSFSLGLTEKQWKNSTHFNKLIEKAEFMCSITISQIHIDRLERLWVMYTQFQAQVRNNQVNKRLYLHVPKRDA